MIWINIISTVINLTLLCILLHNNSLQKKNYKVMKEMLDMTYELSNMTEKDIDAQNKFNDSTIENIERHEEALKIIVNEIDRLEMRQW